MPTPTIDTRASDPTDGNQSVIAGATHALDRVELGDLVPGTDYMLIGEVIGRTSMDEFVELYGQAMRKRR